MPRGRRIPKGFSASRLSPLADQASVRFGARVRDLRKSAGLTQEGLASRASIDSKYVQDIERGDANPTLAMLVALAQAFGVSLAQLLDGI
jgi:transcriptional regulator with XRE-family HTH domain